MSKSLRRIFSLVGSFGLMAPYSGHEADLLLARKKPLAMFCVLNEEPGDTVTESDRKDRTDVTRLDHAVSEGRLCKIEVPIALASWNGRSAVMHLYSLPRYIHDLREVASFQRLIWEGREQEAFLPRDIGIYLGYTQNDVDLFKDGGYESKPFVVRHLLKLTHSCRKAARLAALDSLEPP